MLRLTRFRHVRASGRKLWLELTATATLLVLFTLAASASQAALVSPADRAAIRNVILQQMEAFKGEDGPAAFAFASPDIQAMFGDANRFMSMVRSQYRPVYRSAEVDFSNLIWEPAGLSQWVRIMDVEGREHWAVYLMEKQPDGTWRIDGCQLTEPPGWAA